MNSNDQEEDHTLKRNAFVCVDYCMAINDTYNDMITHKHITALQEVLEEFMDNEGEVIREAFNYQMTSKEVKYRKARLKLIEKVQDELELKSNLIPK